MFTNQRILGMLLILFIIAASSYFAFLKFKQEVTSATASPSPSPQNLDFIFNELKSSLNEQSSSLNKTPSPQPTQQTLKIQSKPQTQPITQTQPTPQPTELPLEKNKKLSQFPGVLTDESLQNKKGVIQTAKGIIQIQIFPETKLASSNFMILAAAGFYNGLIFHRVEDWLIQGGDPSGSGSGGPGYQFSDEPVNRPYVKGVVAMANAGPNTNGSQFFILKKDYPLEPKYTIFGQVIAGMDIAERIVPGDVMQKVVIQNLQ